IRKKLFFNLGYEWEESVQSGALMMRPVFGKLTGKQSPIETYVANNSVYVYPSLANTTIHIQSAEEIVWYKIYSIHGQMLLTGTENHIQIGHLSQGFYSVQILTKNGNVYTKSFVKK